MEGGGDSKKTQTMIDVVDLTPDHQDQVGLKQKDQNTKEVKLLKVILVTVTMEQLQHQ